MRILICFLLLISLGFAETNEDVKKNKEQETEDKTASSKKEKIELTEEEEKEIMEDKEMLEILELLLNYETIKDLDLYLEVVEE